VQFSKWHIGGQEVKLKYTNCACMMTEKKVAEGGVLCSLRQKKLIKSERYSFVFSKEYHTESMGVVKKIK